ncbi:MAG TPA: RibD family protein, partial [Xylella sp.]
QHWRARAGAILTGAGTVLADDPALTVRLDRKEIPFLPPLRVVLDSRLRSLSREKVRDSTAPTLYLHGFETTPPVLQHVAFADVPQRDGALDLVAALYLLGERGINEVQVEAGATLCGALLHAGLVDELLIYMAPLLLGDAARPLLAGLQIGRMDQCIGLKVLEVLQVGHDVRLLLCPLA